MPIFEFSCRGCGRHFEELLSYDQMQSGQVACPDCGAGDVVRSLSAFATGGSGSGPGLPPCGGSGCGGAFT